MLDIAVDGTVYIICEHYLINLSFALYIPNQTLEVHVDNIPSTSLLEKSKSFVERVNKMSRQIP